MTTLDPVTMADWQISEAAERDMKSVQQLAGELGLEPHEVLPYGHHVGKVDQASVLRRLADRPDGKYVDVTAITPTTLGEGKTTTTMGLVEGWPPSASASPARSGSRRAGRPSTSRARPPAAGLRSAFP